MMSTFNIPTFDLDGDALESACNYSTDRSDDIHLVRNSSFDGPDMSWLASGHNYMNVSVSTCLALDEYCMFRTVIDIFIVGILCVAGFIGNTLVIVVLQTDCLNMTVSFLLQALAVADNLYLVSCLFMQTLKTLCECTDWIPNLKRVYPYMEPYVWPSASIAQTMTVWLVVLITVDRYCSIHKPFDKTWHFTKTTAKKATICIMVVAIVYNVPRFFEHVTLEMPNFCARAMQLIARHSTLRKNRLYFIIYKTILYFLFRVILPLGTLSILNTRLIITLRRARQKQAVLTKASRKSDTVTVILVAMVTIFIICELPDFIIRTLVTVQAFTGVRMKVYYYNTITNMLLTVNSSVNCLIYGLTGRRFRKILGRLFCRTCSSPRHRHLVADYHFPSDQTQRKKNLITDSPSDQTLRKKNMLTDKETTM